MGRNVAEVIDQVLGIVPEAEQELRSRLEALRTSAKYKAPELMGDIWNGAAHLLNDSLPFPPQEEWQWKVASTFANQELEAYRTLVIAQNN